MIRFTFSVISYYSDSQFWQAKMMTKGRRNRGLLEALGSLVITLKVANSFYINILLAYLGRPQHLAFFP